MKLNTILLAAATLAVRVHATKKGSGSGSHADEVAIGEPAPTAPITVAPAEATEDSIPITNSNDLYAESELYSRLTATAAFPTSRFSKITTKSGTGQYITVANPFFHARSLYAASLLGSTDGLTSYVVEPTRSLIGEDYAVPDETITVGPSTYQGVNVYTAAAYTSDGFQNAETLSASCAINSGSTAVCSYGYFGGPSPQAMETRPPITLTAAQFNTLEVLAGSGVGGPPQTTGTPAASQSRTSTGSAAGATSTSAGIKLELSKASLIVLNMCAASMVLSSL